MDAEQLPLRERNKQRVTQRIISAAVELFKAQGYQHTTMDDIAAKAEISRATLFNYFPSKESLLLPWGQESLEKKFMPEFMAYLETQPSTLDMLQYLLRNMSETILTFPDVMQAFLRETLKAHQDDDQRKAGNALQDLFVQVLRRGQERGEIRGDLPADNIARYLGALQMSLFFHLVESPSPDDCALEIERLLAFIKTGLLPQP
jgi:AcrR family transcriptional regulator